MGDTKVSQNCNSIELSVIVCDSKMFWLLCIQFLKKIPNSLVRFLYRVMMEMSALGFFSKRNEMLLWAIARLNFDANVWSCNRWIIWRRGVKFRWELKNWVMQGICAIAIEWVISFEKKIEGVCVGVATLRTSNGKWKFVIRGDDGGEVVIRHARKPFLANSHTLPRERIHVGFIFSETFLVIVTFISLYSLFFSGTAALPQQDTEQFCSFRGGRGINSSDWIFCFILIKRNKIPAVGYSAAIAWGSFRDGIIICSVIIEPLNMLIE